MKNDFSEDTKAILLLCAVLDKNSSVKPLTLTEYNSLVKYLVREGMRPGDLLKSDRVEEISLHARIEFKRLSSLLTRGFQLGIALEEWTRNGVWVVSRSETDYPERLKKHLKEKAPALLFCIGNPKLLSGGGIAIVGSRNVDSNGTMFTRSIARQCVKDGMNIVSGGARGVDQTAMNTSMENGGITIGVIADSLLKKSLERSTRKSIASGNLLLLSPYHPKAGFQVGNAMARNKLIYAMADYGVVVCSEAGQGGTWAGAKEELFRDNSLPVFVRTGDDIPSGNKKLLEMGALEWPKFNDSNSIIQQLNFLVEKGKNTSKGEQLGLFDDFPRAQIQAHEIENSYCTEERVIEKNILSIYQAVLPIILAKLNTPKSCEELAEELDVSKAQLSKWLKHAVEEKVIDKLFRPVRFSLPENDNL